MLKNYFSIVFIAMLCLLFSVPVNANIVVKIDVQQGPDAVNDTDSIYVKLFDELTPLTVENYLNYINDGDYINSIFHRTVPNSVIQGGGFVFDSTNSFNDVPTDPPVVNEYAKSNTLGTIAMAKLGGDPDSATNEWFFNLDDNSANLDNQNGGFTVFGEVIADGMTIVNTMASVPVFDLTFLNSLFLGTAFGSLPLLDYTEGQDINFSNLIVITDINERFSINVDYDPVSTILGDTLEPEDVDFGAVIVGSIVIATVTIKNNHIDTLDIGAIANSDLLELPYQTNVNECDFISLEVNESCEITINFTPVSAGVFDDTFNIEFTTLSLSYSLNIHGESLVTSPSPNIIISSRSVDFGEARLFEDTDTDGKTETIQISNEGNVTLTISSYEIATTTFTEEYRFLADDCLRLANRIAPGESCDILIGFFPENPGEINGTFTIYSDDFDEAVLVIDITGSGSLDIDGVIPAIEDLGPNNGDGNYDDLADSTQNNVVSIASANGNYATIVTDLGTDFTDFKIVTEDKLINPPAGSQLGTVYQFIQDFGEPAVGVGITAFGIILPANITVDTYYIYGPTPDNINPHWYEFEFDGLTGAQIFNNVAFPTASGGTVQKTLIKLSFVDSLRGDGDLAINGKISIQGAYAVSSGGGESDSGSLDIILILSILILLSYFRYLEHYSIRYIYGYSKIKSGT